MKSLSLAGVAGMAAALAHAQPLQLNLARNLDAVVVTATRGIETPVPTLRDTVVVTREDLEAHAGLTLAEILQRRAGVEFRATGGPGQPTGLFLRGAGAAQTLVLVDGLRVGSATAGTTSIESIAPEMVERIEVVKGAMSSLYGSEAIGGVIQIFTRGKDLPHLFGAASYGSHDDRRASAGLATAEGDTRMSLSTGWRKVDAPSATNASVPFGVHDPDRDPHENAFAVLHASHRLWQGELVSLRAFASRSKTRFDGGDPADRNRQTISGARLDSSSQFTRAWATRLSIGHGRDELEFLGPFPARFETRQDQASWINAFATRNGSLVLGAEAVRQRVLPGRVAGEPMFTRTRRDTYSGFASMNEVVGAHQVEASLRRDDDEQFGKRNTGTASYGVQWSPQLRLSATLSRGFRAPTFNDLYLTFPGYTPNPNLRPERSRGAEVSVRGSRGGAQWRVTAFDTRLEDLIIFTAQGVRNVNRARVRGVEASAEAEWMSVRWRGHLTFQRPRDEQTGARLQARAERFGALEASRVFGPWLASAALVASGERFDSVDESPDSRLPGYVSADLRLRYAWPKHWSVEIAVTNLADRRYEYARGYDAPGREVRLTVRFDAF